MKKILIAILSLAMVLPAVQAQTGKKKPVHTPTHHNKPEDRLRQYFFVMLTRGESHDQDSAAEAAVQRAHLANINKLYYEGKLKLAGPFGDDGNWRGIFIFDCASKEEAEALLKTDPAIVSGRLAYEIHPWWTAETGNFIRGVPKKN
ncbi:MAG: YciI family protein [Bacteroidota bacterium]